MSDPKEKSEGFTVTDRRSFDASGERKPETESAPAISPPATPAEPAKSEPARPLPPADFATLVLSLGSSVLMYLGEAPEGGKPPRNLPMAKHAIDLLNVLEEKTKGNLSPEEEHILGSLLFDLRLRYVEALKGSPAGG
jgi:hypothetical protein